MDVTVNVSEPYVVIGGGWTGMRPQGRRRTYTAEVEGKRFEWESKDEIQRRIRHHLYRTGHRSAVKFEFVKASS